MRGNLLYRTLVDQNGRGIPPGTRFFTLDYDTEGQAVILVEESRTVTVAYTVDAEELRHATL